MRVALGSSSPERWPPVLRKIVTEPLRVFRDAKPTGVSEPKELRDCCDLVFNLLVVAPVRSGIPLPSASEAGTVSPCAWQQRPFQALAPKDPGPGTKIVPQPWSS